MGKISNIMENGIAALVGTLEFRQQSSKKRSYQSPVKSIPFEANFKSFVFGEKLNRKYFLITLLGTVAQFVVFKILYPFPDFISDSYNYIDTAALHMSVNLWPIGYGKFLWIIHLLTHSDIALVGIQYILLQSSLLYFYFTILFLYRPAKITSLILFIFLLFNPLFIYISNCVLSDALFTALSITLMTQFFWMYYKPKVYQIFITSILVGICFTLRYTAIYYPIIAAIVIIFSKYNTIAKLVGSLAPICLIVTFILFTQQRTKEITGTPEFSVFGGWQIANNALYMYDHINVDNQQLPENMRELDQMVKKYFKIFKPTSDDFSNMPGTYFIKVSRAPLKQYMYARYKINDPYSQFLAWGKVSPIYNAYGTYLIKKYPIEFFKNYLLLNINNYLFPHLEKFGSYNVGENTVGVTAQWWFHYDTPVVRSISKGLQGQIFIVYIPVFMALNIYFLCYFLWLVLWSKLGQLEAGFRKGLLLTVFFLFVNFGFSVFATPVVLRYQIISMTLLFTFSLLLLGSSYNTKSQEIKK